MQLQRTSFGYGSLIEILELDTIELGSVVSDDGIWETKSTYDVADHKVDYFLRCDSSKGYGFRLLGKVISYDDGVLRTTFGQR